MAEALPNNTFVFRSDVKSYYASIDHDILFTQLEELIADPRVLELLQGYIRRTIYDRGRYEDVTQGISLGCPVSPLIGALYLKPLDERMQGTGLFYARFMDDWVVLAPTRWKLRVSASGCPFLTTPCQNQHPSRSSQQQSDSTRFGDYPAIVGNVKGCISAMV